MRLAVSGFLFDVVDGFDGIAQRDMLGLRGIPSQTSSRSTWGNFQPDGGRGPPHDPQLGTSPRRNSPRSSAHASPASSVSVSRRFPLGKIDTPHAEVDRCLGELPIVQQRPRRARPQPNRPRFPHTPRARGALRSTSISSLSGANSPGMLHAPLHGRVAVRVGFGRTAVVGPTKGSSSSTMVFESLSRATRRFAAAVLTNRYQVANSAEKD